MSAGHSPSWRPARSDTPRGRNGGSRSRARGPAMSLRTSRSPGRSTGQSGAPSDTATLRHSTDLRPRRFPPEPPKPPEGPRRSAVRVAPPRRPWQNLRPSSRPTRAPMLPRQCRIRVRLRLPVPAIREPDRDFANQPVAPGDTFHKPLGRHRQCDPLAPGQLAPPGRTRP